MSRFRPVSVNPLTGCIAIGALPKLPENVASGRAGRARGVAPLSQDLSRRVAEASLAPSRGRGRASSSSRLTRRSPTQPRQAPVRFQRKPPTTSARLFILLTSASLESRPRAGIPARVREWSTFSGARHRSVSTLLRYRRACWHTPITC